MALSNRERQTRYRESLKARAAKATVVTDADRDYARGRIADYTAQRDKLMEVVAQIDGGMRHSSAMGNEPMRDDTDEWRQDLVSRVETFERLIEFYRRDAEA